MGWGRAKPWNRRAFANERPDGVTPGSMNSVVGSETILSVRDLRVSFRTGQGALEAVGGISYDLGSRETLAIVGESGSGKSVSALSMLRLVPEGSASVGGRVLFQGEDLLSLGERDLRRIRGKHISMIFQDPMTSLNPVRRIRGQMIEGLRLHLGLSRRAAGKRAVELLRLVGIPSPETRIDDYAHEFSGGMRQRIMIAMALACEPEVLVADEPTTALDVTTQAQILELIRRLQERLGMAVIWITHDLGVVAGIADRVLVMYAGRVVEDGFVNDVYADPRHPYTIGLLDSLPSSETDDKRRLHAIPGFPPNPLALPPGCAFYQRCRFRRDQRCESERPPLRTVGPDHHVATFCEMDGIGR